VDNITSVLKGFVIAGGIALVAGTVLLVVLIGMQAAGDGAPDPPEGSAGVAGSGPSEAPCEGGVVRSAPSAVPLPAGARVEQVVPSGACLILLGVDGAGQQFVALVDPRSGERLSLLLIRPEP
jgi:hypothetical protein